MFAYVIRLRAGDAVDRISEMCLERGTLEHRCAWRACRLSGSDTVISTLARECEWRDRISALRDGTDEGAARRCYRRGCRAIDFDAAGGGTSLGAGKRPVHIVIGADTTSRLMRKSKRNRGSCRRSSRSGRFRGVGPDVRRAGSADGIRRAVEAQSRHRGVRRIGGRGRPRTIAGFRRGARAPILLVR